MKFLKNLTLKKRLLLLVVLLIVPLFVIVVNTVFSGLREINRINIETSKGSYKVGSSNTKT